MSLSLLCWQQHWGSAAGVTLFHHSDGLVHGLVRGLVFSVSKAGCEVA
jgi:hypothetical protein